MQSQNALLNRALGHQLVDKQGLRLANAVGPVGGLVFYGRVPPWVVVDDGIGLRQVQAYASGLQADEEQWHRAAGELLYQRVAVLALAGELDPGDAVLFQFGLDQRQHAGELREQQDAPPLGHHLGQQLH